MTTIKYPDFTLDQVSLGMLLAELQKLDSLTINSVANTITSRTPAEFTEEEIKALQGTLVSQVSFGESKKYFFPSIIVLIYLLLLDS